MQDHVGFSKESHKVIPRETEARGIPLTLLPNSALKMGNLRLDRDSHRMLVTAASKCI